jgi:hypothetical protein
MAGPRITPFHSQNLISPPDPRFKQALNRPVFLLAKPPDEQTGPIAGFSVRLPSKTHLTGRSLITGKSESGLCTCPDGPFLPIRAGESTDTLKKRWLFSLVRMGG